MATPFSPVSTQAAFPRLEEEVLAFWKQEDIFRRSIANRADGPRFVFYEGPPTANGSPGIHHVLARVFKDVILRYRTMQGDFVPRRGGWDTHGLPVELEVEKTLGFGGKKDIEDFGIAEFNRLCRESVFRYVQDWEKLTDRIAFWVDMDDAYVTYSNDYIESCWWIIRQLWERDLVFQDYKVTPHCPRCGTSLSSHEVALGYKDDTDDPSVYVRMRLAPDQPGLPGELRLDEGVPTSFLVWTTTPWTLPGNVAVALAPDATYALVELERDGQRERLILADALRPVLDTDHTVLALVPGRDLAGARYLPLYDQQPDRPAYRAVTDPFVSMDDGTGIVHIAPAFGETDLQVGRREELPVLVTVDLKGIVTANVPGQGEFVKKADPKITKDLEQRGLLWKAGRLKHTYPFCWRCSTPLLYYAKTSWYLRTTAIKEQLLEGNQEIAWYPGHIRDGRFGDWLANNVDWAVSRERYWGTPLNIWRCDECGQFECIGSFQELAARSGQDLGPDFDPHRPGIDAITVPCNACGAPARRVPEVLDAWFDSGAMPYAQQHYPFGDPAAFDQNFPADFICEAVDQTRGWFYSLHALSELLRGEIAYRNVICLGHILDAKGEKMSKSRGNIVNPWDVIEAHGVDAIRWTMYASGPPGQPRRFSQDLVGETVRRFFLTLWNTYAFFVLYANLDGWQPGTPVPDEARTPLDRWVLAELHQTVAEATAAMDAYDPTTATRRIQDFVDGLSNWYVRRSRRRFWKAGDDADQAAAYATLHECLETTGRLMAPFAPFMAETLYQNLAVGRLPHAAPSVHCADWPVAQAALVDDLLIQSNRLAMRVVSLGRAARSRASLRVRQPLASITVRTRNDAEAVMVERFRDVIADELNVREVLLTTDEAAIASVVIKPNLRVLGPRLGGALGAVQQALKTADAAVLAEDLRVHGRVELGGQVLERDDLLIEYQDAPGYATGADAGMLVAVSTTLTPELEAEGQVREVAHHLQGLRKSAGLEVSDRIETWIDAPAALQPALTALRDYLEDETLSTRLELGTVPDGVTTAEVEVPGQGTVRLGLRRATGTL